MSKIERMEINNYDIKVKHDGQLDKHLLPDFRSALVHLIYMYVLGSVVDNHVEEITITRKHKDSSGIGEEECKPAKYFWEKYRLWEK